MAKTKLRVLLIEDEPDYVEIIKTSLQEADASIWEFEFESARRLDKGLILLKQQNFDVLLLDLSLPDTKGGLDTIHALQAQNINVPIVIMTNLSDESMAAKAVGLGAQDYLIKAGTSGALLKRAIVYAIERKKFFVEMQRLEQLKAEIKERRQLDRFKDDLLSGLSDELARPLASAGVALDELIQTIGPAKLPEYSMQRASLAQRHVKQLQKVIFNLLEFSRLRLGKLPVHRRTMNILELIDQMAPEFEAIVEKKNLKFRKAIPDDLPGINADPEMVARVIAHFLENASRFAGRSIFLAAKTVKDGVQISVADDGPQIPAEEIPSIFQSFIQTRKIDGGATFKGTGLWLAVCKEIVALHQGRIWAESQPGLTTFHCVFPEPVANAKPVSQ